MKILHTADWHLGKLLEGRSRLEEQKIVMEQLTAMADDRQADMVCIAGDIFDNGHPSAGAEALLYQTLKKLSRGGERLVVLISGNHDQPSRLEAVIPLVREHGILIYGTPRSKIESGQYGKFQIESLDEGVFSFEKGGERAVVACVPYASERTLNEVLYRDQEEDQERALTYARKMQELFAQKARWFSKEAINILMAHVFTLGCIKDGSEQSLSLGNSYLLPMETFPEEADYVALGHVHRPQKAVGSQGRIRYSGSPLPYRLQETAVAKECLLVTLAPGRKPEIEDLYFNNPKPIEKWVCRDYQEALEKCRENQNRPCYVYLHIHTDSFIREEQIKELKKYKEDILEVVPLFPSRDREEEKGSFLEKSFQELFTEYYTEKKGVEPEAELLETLAEIIEKEREDETDLDKDKRAEQLSGSPGN